MGAGTDFSWRKTESCSVGNGTRHCSGPPSKGLRRPGDFSPAGHPTEREGPQRSSPCHNASKGAWERRARQACVTRKRGAKAGWEEPGRGAGRGTVPERGPYFTDSPAGRNGVQPQRGRSFGRSEGGNFGMVMGQGCTAPDTMRWAPGVGQCSGSTASCSQVRERGSNT